MDQSRDSDTTTSAAEDSEARQPAASRRWSPVRTAVWAVASLAFLGYLAFGSVQARIWRFGQLEIESKSILGVWRVQAESLPDVSNGWLLQLAFNGSAIVVVVCVVLLMRYLLLEAGDESAAVEPDQT